MKRRTRRNPALTKYHGEYQLVHEDPYTGELTLVGRTDDLHGAIDEALRRASLDHDYLVQGGVGREAFSIQVRRFGR